MWLHVHLIYFPTPQIYEGDRVRHNVTGTSPPAPFVVTSGSFRVLFDSDAIQTDEGFSLTYSIGEWFRFVAA